MLIEGENDVPTEEHAYKMFALISMDLIR